LPRQRINKKKEIPVLNNSHIKVLVACEESGRVRDAFTARGFDAWSCDILPSSTPGKHIHSSVLPVLNDGWDVLIAFPPCTHLSSSGARWWAEKRADGRQQRAIDFFMALAEAPIAYRAIENPVGVMSTVYRKPDQIIQPWQHGHGETKATCLWLTGLPLLQPSNVVPGRVGRVHAMPPSKDRSKLRGITYEGVASAMAKQWGDFLSQALAKAEEE
jgi:hypothetical protein